MNLGITGIDVTPNCALTHSWSVADATDENKYKFLDYMLYGSISGTAVAVDYNFCDYYDATHPITICCQSHKPELTSTSGAYPGIYWGYRFGSAMIGKHPNAHSTWDNNHNFWFKYNRQKKYTLNWVDLTNEYFDKLFADAYYKYQGIPICKVEKPGVVKFKLKFSNNKVSDGSNRIEINKEKIIDSANGDYIYIKVAPNIDDQVVSVSAVDDIIFTES